ncbi:DNL-type zinc finger protein [Linum perenne]
MKVILAYGISCPAIVATSSSKLRAYRPPASSGPCQPFSSASIKASAFRYPRLRISQRKVVVVEEPQRRLSRLPVAAAAAADEEDYGTHSGAEPSISSDGAATIDIKLPRRSLLVQFTCNDCGERTQRLINRLAYERGLVFVQCAGCDKYHKLADNLGLIVEYDLREENEITTEQNAD